MLWKSPVCKRQCTRKRAAIIDKVADQKGLQLVVVLGLLIDRDKRNQHVGGLLHKTKGVKEKLTDVYCVAFKNPKIKL